MTVVKKNLGLCLLLFFPAMLSAQPQKFVAFDVSPSGNSVIIRWEMPAGADTFSYQVEKSADSIFWNKIGDASKNISHKYLIVDGNPLEGIVYYRIRQITSRNNSFLSATKWVLVNTTDEVYIWPNPANGVLHIKTPFSKGNLEITDSEGKLMLRVEITNYITEIFTETFAKGIYFIRIRVGGKIITERFIKA